LVVTVTEEIHVEAVVSAAADHDRRASDGVMRTDRPRGVLGGTTWEGAHIGRQCSERREVAAKCRKRLDQLFIDHLAHDGLFGLDQRRGAGHFDGLGDFADLQSQIDPNVVVGRDGDDLRNRLTEAALLDRDLIAAGCQVWKRVQAAGVRAAFERLVAVHVDEQHSGVWNDGSTGVRNEAADGAPQQELRLQTGQFGKTDEQQKGPSLPPHD
jgi:hypothetical protein